jgi:hypothetical protein
MLFALPTLAAGLAESDRVSERRLDSPRYASTGYSCSPQDSATTVVTQITSAFLARTDSVAIAIRTSFGFPANGPISVTAETDSSVCRAARLKLDSVLSTLDSDSLRRVYIDRVDTLLVLHDFYSPRPGARIAAVVLARENFRYVGRWR